MTAPPPAFTIIIPARLASTRLPGKPLADLAGKPMIVRVAEQARRTRAVDVVVATDAEAIAEAVLAAGFRVVMTRGDHPSGTDRLAEAARQLALDERHIVVNLQGDEPELSPTLLEAVASRLAQDEEAAMATAAHPIDSVADWLNPNVVKVVLGANGRALYFSRAPIPFARDALAGFPATLPATLPDPGDAEAPLRHIGLYSYRAGFLQRYSRLTPTLLERTEALEQLRVLAHGFAISVLKTDDAPPAGIDTPADLAAARARWDAASRSGAHAR